MPIIKTIGRTLVIVCTLILVVVGYGHTTEKKSAEKVAKLAASQIKESPPAVRMERESKAMDILKAACDRLAAAHTLRFTAVTTYENPSRLGVPLAYTVQSQVSLQRPDKLKIITPGDGPASEFYYDGKVMTAFAPGENLVAVTEAPSSIDAALQTAFDVAAIYFPFTDLIVADPYKDLTDDLILAFYIGQSNVVGGVTTDMVAYATNDVFIQIWIGVNDHLPRMIRAVYRQDAAHLRHQVELSNWQLDATLAPETFSAAIPVGVNPMPFAHPNTQQAKGPVSTNK